MKFLSIYKGQVLALCALACLVLLLTPASGQASLLGFRIEGALGLTAPRLDGTTSFSGGALDLGRDMNLDTRQTEVRGWVSLEHPLPFLPDLKLEYTPFSASGEATVIGGLTWGDLVLSDGVQGRMDAKINMLDATVYWHIPMLRTLSADILDLQWGLTLRYIDAKIEVTDSQTGNSSTGKGSLPVPMLYLGARIEPLKWLTAMVELRGIAYGDNKVFDVKAAARFYPFSKFIFFGVGYTYSRFDLPDIGDLNLDVRLSGPFAEVGFSF